MWRSNSSHPVVDGRNYLPKRCTMLQIRYSCGHQTGGEFVKCQQHINQEDRRCSARRIFYVEGKQSTHKCRQCLRSE